MPKGFLEAVLARKRNRLKELSLREESLPPRRDFLRALSEGTPPRIVAEIKRLSPSRGPLRPDLDAKVQAKAYELGGAKAISVLTDEAFGGSPEDLREVKKVVDLPLLRKDFLIDPLELEESLLLGASAVLLIARILPGDELQEMVKRSLELGLEPVVEVHTERDLERTLETPARVIGINSRDLETLRVDLGVIEALFPKVPKGRVVLAESGIRDREDIERLMDIGVENFLIGEALVLADDPVEKLKGLIDGKG